MFLLDRWYIYADQSDYRNLPFYLRPHEAKIKYCQLEIIDFNRISAILKSSVINLQASCILLIFLKRLTIISLYLTEKF